ncbi:hypothetical protein J2X45_003923 [Caulobacter sp. BE264]|uniref:nuclease n=1 Tax=Caulobacter sp. BE264 TaxID=2817724 RepID=UPI00286070CE|nr:nuclease [Caulobacter sp. BE264]MDR7232813.1 hypothetical protein [Caulobacter sp. BE264]
MIRTLLFAAGLSLAAGAALADPCEAPVRGFKAGDRISGVVWYAGDGDSLCVGPGPNPSTWIEVREADWFAPELNEPGGRQAKAVMDRLVGRRAVCTVRRGQNGKTSSYDRVIAACSVDGVPIGARMRAAGIAPGGRGVR